MHLILEAAASGGPWSDLGYVALVGAAFFVLFGARSNQSKKDLQASVVALQGSLDSRKDENELLKSRIEQQDTTIENLTTQTNDLRGAVETLRSVVTSKDLITNLADMTRRGFIAQGVSPEKLAIPA